MNPAVSTPLPLLPLIVDRVPDALLRMLAQEGVPIAPFEPGRPSGSIVLYDSSCSSPPRTLLPEQRLLDVAALRCGEPFDPFQSLDGTVRTYWQVGPWEAGEEVAAVDRRRLRERILGKLRGMVERAGGVWMRLAPFPRPYRTAANFRFDHDRFVAADFRAVIEAIRGHEHMTTHFVCASTHETASDALAELRACDVGSHGYRHHTYRTRRENRANISQGIGVLRRLGFEPSGFAAPLGRFNPGLAEALAELRITYSSEFAARYDDLPTFAPSSDVLQIPIHPVCLGIVLEALGDAGNDASEREAATATAEYFAEVVAEKHAAGEPIFLYGHPDGRLGRYPEVLTRTFEAVDALPDVWQTTLTEFQRWWRVRGRCEWSVVAHDAGFEIRPAHLPSGYDYAIEWSGRDGAATLPLAAESSVVTAAAMRFVPKPSLRRSLPVRVDHAVSFQGRIKNYLDWEFETPLDEIDVGEWRGWLKRTLRRIRSGARTTQDVAELSS